MLKNRKSKFIEKLEWGRFVTPLSDKNIAPFNWYSFKHRFGSELASNVFHLFGLVTGDIILDPFSGGATTLVKAKLDGLNAVGLDISPFSVFLSNVLTKTFNSNSLLKSLKKIPHEIDSNVNIPDVSILYKAFSINTLKYIFSLWNSIKNLQSVDKKFFSLSLFSILNNISKAKKSGGFLRITDQSNTSIKDVKKMFIESSEKMIEDVKSFKYSDASINCFLGDARNYPNNIYNNKYDAILTSPPYPNRHDYTRIYELELLIGFINNNRSLKNLRYDTLRSHVEAKKKFESKGYIIPKTLDEKLTELKQKELNNSRVISTLCGYFEDMYLCLMEMYKVLKRGKYIGLVISNVRYAGIVIPVDELLSEIGEQVGLKTKNIIILRYKGNSSQQMLKYKKEPVRESLIIWRK